MKKKSFTLVSILISAVFLISILYLVLGVLFDKRNGPSNAKTKFEQLVQDTTEISNLYTPDTYDFSANFINIVGNVKEYNSLSLTYNGRKIYNYPPNKTNSITVDVYKEEQSIQTKNGESLVIYAEIYKIPPYSVYNHARITFITIMIGTLIAIIILLFAKPNQDNESKYELEFDDDILDISDDSDPIAQFEEENQKNNFSDKFDDIFFEKENNRIQETDNAVTLEETSFDYNEDLLNENITENSNNLYEEIVEDDYNDYDNDIQITEIKQPNNIENQINIKNEEQFLEDLEEDLVSAATNNSDLSLLVLMIEGQNNKSENALRIVQHIEEENKEIKTYEYTDQGFAFVEKNIDLDSMLQKAENINTYIKELDSNLKVTMGISSRTSRMISAERLFTEAKEAEKHAKQDLESPIIAFRVNPDKYKQFVLNAN